MGEHDTVVVSQPPRHCTKTHDGTGYTALRRSVLLHISPYPVEWACKRPRRTQWRSFMSVRMLPDGTIEFDSVEDAVEFRRLSGKTSSCASAEPDQNGTPVDRKRANYVRFQQSLQSHQVAIIRALKESSDGLTAEELAKKVERKAGQIGPMMRHIRDRATKAGLDAKRFIKATKTKPEGGGRPAAVFKLVPDYPADLAEIK